MTIESPFGKLYLALMERIEAEVPQVKYIDQDFGQLEGYVKRPAVKFPAVFIDFQNWTFKNLGDLAQEGEGDVVIHLAFAPMSATDSLKTLAYRKEPLVYYEIEHELFKKLHGWSPGEIFGRLTRINTRSQNGPALRRRPISFKLGFEDYGVDTGITFEPKPEPSISKTIVGND